MYNQCQCNVSTISLQDMDVLERKDTGLGNFEWQAHNSCLHVPDLDQLLCAVLTTQWPFSTQL